MIRQHPLMFIWATFVLAITLVGSLAFLIILGAVTATYMVWDDWIRKYRRVWGAKKPTQ